MSSLAKIFIIGIFSTVLISGKFELIISVPLFLEPKKTPTGISTVLLIIYFLLFCNIIFLELTFANLTA